MINTNLINARFKRLHAIDKLLLPIAVFFAAVLLLLFASMLGYLIKGSMPALHQFGWNFLTNSLWDPVAGMFGGLTPILGTLITSFIALLLAIPISFGIAYFISEFAPYGLHQVLRVTIELLAGIPSIIYGMWGLFIFAPHFATVQPWLITHLGNLPLIGYLFQGAPIGIGLLTAGIILGIMIIPFITSVMQDVFNIVPDVLKESAYALGATTWEVMWNIVIPYCRIGLVGGVMLGLGRALGETMAVAFVIGNAYNLSASLFMPSNTLSSAIANEFSEATTRLYTASLFEFALILFVITFVVLMCSRFLVRCIK